MRKAFIITSLIVIQFLAGCADQSIFRQEYLDSDLISAASQGKDQEVIALLGSGAKINAKDEAEDTALSCAAANGHESVVKILLAQGADVNAKDHNGMTAMDKSSELQILKLLKDAGGRSGNAETGK